MDYSLYRWDQNPNSQKRNNYSLGQAMNVVPGIYGGAWFSRKQYFSISIDGGINYFPFSLDVGPQPKPKEHGLLSFPVLAKIYIFLDGVTQNKRRTTSKTFIYGGYGREWVQSGLYVKGQQESSTYVLHIIEIGLGTGTDGLSSMLFLRGGWGSANSLMLNAGLKFAWENN